MSATRGRDDSPELLARRTVWFEQGLAAYARGEFFEAHEHWERLWRDERDPDRKRFLQGLIQIAAAMHKIQVERKPEPAARLLERAMARLGAFPADYSGIAVGRLLERARRADQAIAKLASAGDERAVLDRELVPAIERSGSHLA